MKFRVKPALIAGIALWACQRAPATGPQAPDSTASTFQILSLRVRLGRVIVLPSAAPLPVGGTLQFMAYGVTRAGDSVVVNPSWSSNNSGVASVTSGGLVTGVAAGSATITATASGVHGTATVTVTDSSSGGGGSGAPTLGPTSTIIVQDGFEGTDLSAWTVDPGRYSLTTTAGRVHSGHQSLQTLFSATNGYGSITRWFMPGYDDVYVRFYVMFQEGFQNLRSDGNGMHFLTVCGNNINNIWACSGKAGIVPTGAEYFYAGLDPEEVGLPTLQPLSFYTYWPDMTCCYGNDGFQAAPKVPLVGGQWQEVVMHIKMNTPGQSDGLQEVWLNGVKKLSQPNMRWRTTTDVRVNQIRFDNYMPGAPQTQYLWIDDVTVWKP